VRATKEHKIVLANHEIETIDKEKSNFDHGVTHHGCRRGSAVRTRIGARGRAEIDGVDRLGGDPRARAGRVSG